MFFFFNSCYTSLLINDDISIKLTLQSSTFTYLNLLKKK